MASTDDYSDDIFKYNDDDEEEEEPEPVVIPPYSPPFSFITSRGGKNDGIRIHFIKTKLN